MIISNSSPLILLARIGKIGLLKELFRKIRIPPAVYEEVIVRGKEERYGDAAIIENGINDFIFLAELNPQGKKLAEGLQKSLGSGESEAIALSVQEKAKFLLIDDYGARKLGSLYGISCLSAPGILLRALREKKLSKEEYIGAITMLSSVSWLSPDIIALFLKEAYKGENNGSHKS